MMYNWQLENWPHFEYNSKKFDDRSTQFFKNAGQSSGVLAYLNSNEKNESIIQLLIQEAMKTSAIEGEMISRVDVVSSIRKNLGFSTNTKLIKDKRTIGIAETIVMSRSEFDLDLSEKMLWSWHSSLLTHDKTIIKGAWRSHKEPMQIISGTYGKEIVHFEAPPSSKLAKEMKSYIKWFNLSRKEIKNPIIRSAIAHLYFESIHPFEDGNGRIGRILSEKVLSQALGQPILISLSNSIENHRTQYYSELKTNQQKLTIDKWIVFFGEMILDAQKNMLQTIEFTIKKTKFIDYAKPLMDNKQQKAINKMLQDENFIGGMNASKYMSITKVSKATATRDLADMVSKKILVSRGGGRSTTYEVNWECDYN